MVPSSAQPHLLQMGCHHPLCLLIGSVSDPELLCVCQSGTSPEVLPFSHPQCPCSLLPPTASSPGRTSSFLLQKPLQCCLQTQVIKTNMRANQERAADQDVTLHTAVCGLLKTAESASTAGDGTSCFLLAWQLRTPTSISTNILTKMYTYRHLLLLLGCLSACNTAQRAEASRGSISN